MISMIKIFVWPMRSVMTRKMPKHILKFVKKMKYLKIIKKIAQNLMTIAKRKKIKRDAI